MKKCGLIAVCGFITLVYAVIAQANAKIDPYFNIDKNGRSPILKSIQNLAGENVVSIIIKAASANSVVGYIKQHNGSVHTIINDVITADLPVKAVQGLSELKDVIYIETSKPMQMNLDISAEMVGATAVHDGSMGEISYTGKDVIIGIVDSGIDWQHEVFINENGESRIISIWDQTISDVEGFNAPAEILDSYGFECTNDQIQHETCPSYDDVGHGTHVAGIVAGRHAIYNGIAPDAELIVVKVAGKPENDELTPTIEEMSIVSNRVIDGINYIFKKAAAIGKPAVVNLSMGTHYGAHDGTSLIESAIDSFLEGSLGRSIVVSAGNSRNQTENYTAGLHAGANINDSSRAFEFYGLAPKYHSVIIDVWQPEDSDLSFAIGVDNYDSYEITDYVGSGDVYNGVSSDGNLNILIDASEDTNILNNKKHVIIYISALNGNEGVDISDAYYTFDLIALGSGSFDSWIVSGGAAFAKREGFFSRSGIDYLAGDSQFSVVIPATASNVISVASYASRNNFYDLSYSFLKWDGYEFTNVGDISPFSSIGPTKAPERTGQKPEITAPGEWIVSAMSGDATAYLMGLNFPTDYDYRFVALSGTSMAAPHVTGAIALLLNKNAELSQSDIEMLLARNAYVTDYTGAVPNNEWGYGVLNILNTLKNFDNTDLETPLPVSEDSIPEVEFNRMDNSRINPGSGGGCQLIGQHIDNTPTFIILFLVATIFILLRRSNGMNVKQVIIIYFLVITSLVAGCTSRGNINDDNLSVLPSDGVLNIGEEGLQIDLDNMFAIYYTFNMDAYEEILLMIPLKHFYPGEVLEVGPDNFLSKNMDQAALIINKYSKPVSDLSGNTPELDNSWISVKGELTLEKTSVVNGGPLVATLSDVVLRQTDISAGVIDREGSEYSISGRINTSVTGGGTDGPVITEYSPASGGLGTEIIMKGFNIHGGDLTIGFDNCQEDFPYESISSYEIKVVITGMCDDTHFNINNSTSSYYVKQYFQKKEPKVYKVDLPDSVTGLEKAVLDEANSKLFILFGAADKLHVYSLVEKKFVDSVPYPLPMGAISTFDIDPSGNYLIIASGGNLYLLDKEDQVVKSLILPDNIWARDIVLNSSDFGLILTSSNGSYSNQKLAVLDVNSWAVSFPEDLTLQSSLWGKAVFIPRYDRNIVAIQEHDHSPRDITVIQSLDDGSYSLLGYSNYYSCNDLTMLPISNEMWICSSVNDYYLNEVRNSEYYDHSLSYVFLPDETQLVALSDKGVLNIYDYTTGDTLVSSISFYKEGDISLSNYKFLDSDKKNLILLSQKSLFHIEYQELVSWINN